MLGGAERGRMVAPDPADRRPLVVVVNPRGACSSRRQAEQPRWRCWSRSRRGMAWSDASHEMLGAMTEAKTEQASGSQVDPPALLFDLDGTLIDSVYQHVLAWQEALMAGGIELSVW